jgi:hypothetical protein
MLYFTIRVRFLVWLMLPDVAVRTTVYVPAGVPFVLVVVDFALLPPHAAVRPHTAEALRATTAAVYTWISS